MGMADGRIKRKCLTKQQWDYIQSQPQICPFCVEKGLIPHPKRNPYEIAHIIPVAESGSNDPENLRWECRYHNRSHGYNNRKSNQEDNDKYFIKG
jgi:hypothetical protein